MDLSFMTAWFDDLLDPKSFNDYCVNGLCVEASDKVSKIVTGVSLRDQLIDAAIAEKADCIIVHHPNGFWNTGPFLPYSLLYSLTKIIAKRCMNRRKSFRLIFLMRK